MLIGGRHAMEDVVAASKPPPPPRGPPAVIRWSTGLFGCLEDSENCLVTLLCTCITFGQLAEVVDRGSISSGASMALYMLVGVVTGWRLQWVYSCTYRSKMRAQYGLQESPLPDCLVHFLCEPCAICQEYRELKNRGFAMDIGWHANMERGGMATVTVPPAMHMDGMTR